MKGETMLYRSFFAISLPALALGFVPALVGCSDDNDWAAGGDSDSNSDGDTDTGWDTDEVCDRWNDDRADLSEGAWSGSVTGCMQGDVSSTGRENALKLVNLYRWLAGLPAVSHSASNNNYAQACSLLMDANNSLSHNPPSSWICYTADGATGAGSSNISTAPGVQGVDRYMVDPGNTLSLIHI